jgi:integrase-like protein
MHDMSRKSDLLASLESCNAAAGGAHGTRDNRSFTFSLFVQFTEARGINIRDAVQISAWHLPEYVNWRRENAEPCLRSLCNELSHLRAVLKHLKKFGIVRNPHYSNKALGIAGGSRMGTKTPLSEERLQEIIAIADGLYRRGFGCLLALERYLGLRRKEAIMADSEQLRLWEKQIQEGEYIKVERGTKGGRRRDTRIPDRMAALIAIIEARRVADVQGGYLVMRADGRSCNLKSVIQIYAAWMCRQKVQGHAARYAFACAAMDAYVALGHSEKSARALTAMDLGHGEGRGTWISSVYCRSRAERPENRQFTFKFTLPRRSRVPATRRQSRNPVSRLQRDSAVAEELPVV